MTAREALWRRRVCYGFRAVPLKLETEGKKEGIER